MLVFASGSATTRVRASTATVQDVERPIQPLPHLTSDRTLSVTNVPDANDALQKSEQAMPAGMLVIGYAVMRTASSCGPATGALRRNVADTSRVRLVATSSHAPAGTPWQWPPQDAKANLGAGTEVSLTVVPCANAPVHPASLSGAVGPHEISPGSLTTAPEPPTVTLTNPSIRLNTARTVVAASSATRHRRATPTHPALQPANVKYRRGLAVSVTTRPAGYVALQRLPQSIRPSLDRTRPSPRILTSSARIP